MEGQTKKPELNSAGNGEPVKHWGWHSRIFIIIHLLSEDYLDNFWEGIWWRKEEEAERLRFWTFKQAFYRTLTLLRWKGQAGFEVLEEETIAFGKWCRSHLGERGSQRSYFRNDKKLNPNLPHKRGNFILSYNFKIASGLLDTRIQTTYQRLGILRAGDKVQRGKCSPLQSMRTWIQSQGTHVKSEAQACSPSHGETGDRDRKIPGS